MRRHLTRYQLSLVALAFTSLALLAIVLIENAIYLRGAIAILWFLGMGYLMDKINRRNPRW